MNIHNNVYRSQMRMARLKTKLTSRKCNNTDASFMNDVVLFSVGWLLQYIYDYLFKTSMRHDHETMTDKTEENQRQS